MFPVNPYSKVKQELHKANQACCKPRDLAKPAPNKFVYVEQSPHTNGCQGSEGPNSPSSNSVSSSNSSGRDCPTPEAGKRCSVFNPTKSNQTAWASVEPTYHGQDLRYDVSINKTYI